MKYQKIIKYIAIGLGIFIIFNIILGVFSMFTSMGFFFSSDKYIEDDFFSLDVVESQNLNIKLNASELVLKTGEKFNISTNNKKVKAKLSNNILFIEDNTRVPRNKIGRVVVEVPSTFKYDNLDIETGAGSIKLDNVSCNVLDLELGAGNSKLNNLYVSKNADIEGGAGNIDIIGSEINNLDLSLGVGKGYVHSKLTGKNSIESGVGELSVDLIGESSDYMINTSKGLGIIKINHVNVKDKTIYGEGKNKVMISGGVGDIKILFK